MKPIYLIPLLAFALNTQAQEIKITTPQASESTTGTKEIYNTIEVQVQPDYPGGIASLLGYINSKIEIAETDANTKDEKVYVSFVIETDGSISDVKTIRDSENKLGKVVEDILNQHTLKWNPGKINDKPVRTRFNLPVTIINNKTERDHSIMVLKEESADNIVKSPDTDTGNKIYDPSDLDVNAEFPGGIKAFYNFILSKVKIQNAPKEDVTLKIYIGFVIEKDGSVNDVKILRDPGYGMAQQIEKIIRQSPNWTPGIKNGVPVRSRYALPVSVNFKDSPYFKH